MVKHVYYKKQATDSAWHLLSKMEKEMRLSRRRERDRRRKERIRQDQLMIAYIKVKYPVIHEEANKYYNTINALFKDKKDLRKTDHFRAQLFQTEYSDNMVLQIPLISTKKAGETVIQDDIATTETLPDIATTETLPDIATTETLPDIATTETLPDITTTETLPDIATTETLPDIAIDNILQDIMPTLEQELPEGLIEQIINELRADPEIAKLMNDIEDNVDEDLDIDIDFENNLLEKELLYYY